MKLKKSKRTRGQKDRYNRTKREKYHSDGEYRDKVIETVKKYTGKNKDKIRVYQKKYRKLNKEKKKIYAQQYFVKNRERDREKNQLRKKKWQKKHAEKLRLYNQEYQKHYRDLEENRIKSNARQRAINNTIQPEKCQICGIKTKLERHHKDYSKPLEVVFLCKRCHGKLHRKLR